jgi:tetratricopeptide (TPR) repeat protein
MLQRNSVILFREELGDPNAQEYGRSGQNQHGIDVLGRRFVIGPHHYVGIQCRCVIDPLGEAEIERDARASLTIKAGLKEIIFATTAPDSTRSTDAAAAVEAKLRAEGHDLTVTVYGWGNLQTLIAMQDLAYSAFVPSAVASTRPQTAVLDPHTSASLAEDVATKVVAKLRVVEIAHVDREPVGDDKTAEDPVLHAKIDMYRDLFRNDGQPSLAKTGLLGLLELDLSAKPWANFRILTNLGAVALELGEEEVGAARYEEALALRPGDPHAVANLALVRTIQRRCDEAMDLARDALAATPRVDAAVAYLLQAAALGDWQGEPDTLIPADLVGTESADIGLAEFLRRRESPRWEEKTLAICARHEGLKQFDRIHALAILSLALGGGLIAKEGKAAVSPAELDRAADEMTGLAEQMMMVHFGHRHDLVAYLNNAAVLLRLAGREGECEILLRKGIVQAGRDPLLLRILALSQASQGKKRDALETLSDSDDGENRLLWADLIAVDRPGDAIVALKAIGTGGDAKLEQSRLRAIGETASRIKDVPALTYAIDSLRALNAADSTAGLFEIRKNEIIGIDQKILQQQLAALATAMPDDADLFVRMMVAEEAMRRDLPAEAVRLLRDRVDFSRSNPAAIIYLQALGAARHDREFRETLAVADASLRDSPEMLWTAGAHAWNVGDVESALSAIRRLLAIEPANAQARLFLVEILIRLDRSAELVAELEKPIEGLSGMRLRDRFRLASLLQQLGFPERAVALAYRLFLENRDNSQAWTTLSILERRTVIKNRKGGFPLGGKS